MANLRIYQDTRRPGTCRSCGARIEWAQLVKTQKRIPFNPPIVALLQQGSLLDGDRLIEFVDTAITPTHFDTCPDAKDWRKPR